VTNGLLTVELISGRMQVGTNEYVTRYPACIPTTGDPNDTNAPTYWAMQKVSNTTLGDHPADDRTGQGVTETIDHDGNVSNNPPMTVITGTVNAYFDTVTKHNIPKVFWDFLNQTGPVYVNDTITNTQVISPWKAKTTICIRGNIIKKNFLAKGFGQCFCHLLPGKMFACNANRLANKFLSHFKNSISTFTNVF
jgi:hypothetical protein